jgi:hypothetical protein
MKAALAPALAGILTVLAFSGAPFAGPQAQTKPAPPKSKSSAGFPDAKTLADRRQAAEKRRLFRTTDPLEFTLIANFKAVNRDRGPISTKTFPATIQFVKDNGTPASIPLQIRTRGHSRRRFEVCEFAPLRLEFPKNLTSGTVFDGHGSLKLGTHCRSVDEFEQYVIREYSAYLINNLLTPRSYRARLAKATYVDALTNKPVASRYAVFIEDDDDVAKRLEGRIAELPGMSFKGVHAESIAMLTLFAYMIGDTDMSMIKLHNVQLVQTSKGVFYPVLYDFDYSGLVNAAYAVPDKIFGLGSVRDRLYRGPCLTAQELEPYFARMRAVKPDVMALYDTRPGLTYNYRRNAKAYLEQFYRTIDRPGDVKRAFIDGCGHREGM